MTEAKKLTLQQLALYLGCDVQQWEGGIYKLEGIDTVLNEVNIRKHGENRGFWELAGNVKPVLRPIQDLKEMDIVGLSKVLGQYDKMDAEENANVIENVKKKGWKAFDGEATISICIPAVIFFLSNHFDIFGWIEQGLAVDKTKLKA